MWTDKEKQMLIDLYPNRTTKELCIILDKTEGQIRGIKWRLGLNAKCDPFSKEEEKIVYEYYKSNPKAIDLKQLSKQIGRPVTSISRFARKRGLTRQDRPMTEQAIENMKAAQKEFRNTDYYKSVVYPANKQMLASFVKNNHPRGMLGKYHSEETRERMSTKHKELWDEMSVEDREVLVNHMKQGIREKRNYRSVENTYSRCRGGYREDLGCYFRSAWEANVARLLNYWGLTWKYEPKRFKFKPSDDGVLSYCPDFYLPELDLWIEVKGWMDEQSKIRLDKFGNEYPDENSKLILINEPAYKSIIKDFAEHIVNWESK